MMNTKYLKIISFVTVCFYSWTLGGIGSLANAAKVVHDMEQRKSHHRKKAMSAEQRLEKTVDTIEAILQDQKSSIENKQDALKARGKEVDSLDEEIRKSFSDTETRLKKANLPPKILKRHHDFVQQYEEYLDVVRHDLVSLESRPGIFRALGKKFDQRRINNIREKIQKRKARAKKKIRNFDPENLPFRNRQLKPKAPRLKKEEFQRDLDNPQANATTENQAKSAALDAVLNFITPSAEAAPPPPTPEDLAENIEIQFTQDIMDKAAELDHDPVKIYNWVRNNIEFVPTWGSIQGAQYCLETLQGNAFDTASLLIALLRASNIPARYVMGTVEIPIDQVMNWVGGFTNSQAALGFIASGGIPVTALRENPNGYIDPDQVGAIGGSTIDSDTEDYQIKYAQMEHVWVEAFVDYVPSRGSRHKIGQEDTWIEMDASFKQFEYTKGLDLDATVPFDVNSILNQIRQATTINSDGSISGMDTNLLDRSMNEHYTLLLDHMSQNMGVINRAKLIGESAIVPAEKTFLVGTLPYKEKVRGDSFAQMPDMLRHKMILSARGGKNYDQFFEYETNLSELVGKKIILKFEPHSDDDADVLESYYEGAISGDELDITKFPQSLPAYMINVSPILLVGDAAVAKGGKLQLGESIGFNIEFVGPYNEEIIENRVKAGEYIALGVTSGSISYKQIDNIKNKIDDMVQEYEADNESYFSDKDVIDDVLYTIVISYLQQAEILSQVNSKNFGCKTSNLPSEAMFASTVSVESLFGIPFSISGGYLEMDADRIAFVTSPLDGNGDKLVEFSYHIGVMSSALEHSVPELFLHAQEGKAVGVSAVKALCLTIEEGGKIFTIDSSNVGAVVSSLDLERSDRENIINAVNSGKMVLVSDNVAVVEGYTVRGYIIVDPSTGSGAFLISGGKNGAAISVGSSIARAVLSPWVAGAASSLPKEKLLKYAILKTFGKTLSFGLDFILELILLWMNPHLSAHYKMQKTFAILLVNGTWSLALGLGVAFGYPITMALSAALMFAVFQLIMHVLIEYLIISMRRMRRREDLFALKIWESRVVGSSS